MINAEKEKTCNCRHSKCIKLYCQCFAARLPCGKNCHCCDCQNTILHDHSRDSAQPARRSVNEDQMKPQKGCACRKSGCTKKYCECYQSGIRCKDTCKCIDCQNNQSMSNKRIVTQLRHHTSEVSNSDNPSQNLYSLYISQSQRQMDTIIQSSDPLSLGYSWLEDCAKSLFQQAVKGGKQKIIQRMIEIIEQMQQNLKFKPNLIEDPSMEEEDSKKLKFQQSPIQSQNLLPLNNQFLPQKQQIKQQSPQMDEQQPIMKQEVEGNQQNYNEENYSRKQNDMESGNKQEQEGEEENSFMNIKKNE